MTAARVDPLLTPCIGVCRMDAADLCAGCGRTLDEIAEWGRADRTRRQAIADAVARRRSPTRSLLARLGWRR